MSRRTSRPIIVSSDDGDAAPSPIALTETHFDEAWLQNIIETVPSVLPIGELEPDFGRPVAICKELPLSLGAGVSGSLDNFILSDRGQIAIVEVKLWRNPEARRKVIAQALDYAAAVFSMRYEDLEQAVRNARKDAKSLFELVNDSRGTQLDEADFVDAITRNLKRGRALVLVVGDGIREDIEALAGLLQSHVGHRFSFGLVEIRPYKMPNEKLLLVPNVLAQTVLIERGVVKISHTNSSGGEIIVEPARASTDPSKTVRKTLSEDEFLDVIGETDREMREHLEALIEKASEFGVFVEMIGAMNLKYPSRKGNAYNLATIRRNLVVDFGPSTWFDRTDVGIPYCETVAALIGGIVKPSGYGPDFAEFAVRMGDGKRMPRLGDLIPERMDEWLDAMRTYIEDARTRHEIEES